MLRTARSASWSCPVPASPCRPGAGRSTSRSRCWAARRGRRDRKDRSRRQARCGCWTRSRTQLAEGRPLTGFSDALSRMGITHVVVRNDLDPARTDAAPPELVNAAIAGSTGPRAVAGFGRALAGHRRRRSSRSTAPRPPDQHPRRRGRRTSSRAGRRSSPISPRPVWSTTGQPRYWQAATRTRRSTWSPTATSASRGPSAACIRGLWRDDVRRAPSGCAGRCTTTPAARSRQTSRWREYAGATPITASSSRGTPTSSVRSAPSEHPYAAFDASGLHGLGDGSVHRSRRAVDRGPARRHHRLRPVTWPSTTSAAPTSARSG